MNTQEHEKGAFSGHEPSRTPSSTGFHPWEVMVRRRWQLLSCLVLVCGVALAMTTLRKPTYEAVTRVEVVTREPLAGGLGLRRLLVG